MLIARKYFKRSVSCVYHHSVLYLFLFCRFRDLEKVHRNNKIDMGVIYEVLLWYDRTEYCEWCSLLREFLSISFIVILLIFWLMSRDLNVQSIEKQNASNAN